MTVTTSNGETFQVDWMYPQQHITERLMIGLHDDRPLMEIAASFSGCEKIHRDSEEEGDMDCDGYTELITLSRSSYGMDNGYVTITLSKPVKE